MRMHWAGVALIAGLTSAASAQVTHVATFENFTEGQAFKPSFTDPLSGITFRDSTASGHGFSIDYAIDPFGVSTYLTSGGYTPGDGRTLGYDFGFTADLPAPAIRVGLDVAYVPGTVGSPAGTMLRAYNTSGAVVAQTTVPGFVASPFHLEATSLAYDIVRLSITVPDIATGYDNVSYTVLPEPVGMTALVCPVLASLAMRRRR